MTAQALNIFVLDLADPDWNQDPPQRVNSSISFHLLDNTDIRTLSTNGPESGDSVKGLLYVPTLPSSDPCFNISKHYIPNKVTRRSDLPDSEFSFVAIAPWISVNCTSSYLAAARLDPVKALIFYHPDNGTVEPPPANDPSWSLQDGGRFKSENDYGIYAVPGTLGSLLMTQLSLYSGNMTDVPHGSTLTEIFDPRDFVRLFTMIDIGDDDSNLPSLWVFLLIVLGILLAIITGTSAIMRVIQRRNRQNLRRRVANGEVDLEALGIKRLNVPQGVLDQMPLHTYSADDSFGTQVPRRPAAPPEYSPTTQTLPRNHRTINGVLSSTSPTDLPTGNHQQEDELTFSQSSTTISTAPRPHHVQFAQNTCPICLDDFESNATQVRELPCGHIFHPECVDMFLRETSSLCPMCKKTVLPRGYCPDKVTNAMVRRERLVRRIRERVTLEEVIEEPSIAGSTLPVRSFSIAAGTRMASFPRPFVSRAQRRISSAPTPSSVEMAWNPGSSVVVPPSASTPSLTDPTLRREWGRNRLVASLGNRRTAEDEDEERELALPKWRKAIGSIFPGLR